VLAHGENLLFHFFLLCLCSKNSNGTENSLCVDWLEADRMSAMSTCFLTFLALVFHRTHVFSACLHWCRRTSDSKSWAELLWIRTIVFKSTVPLTFPCQHAIKSRQNQCLCNSVICLFELFYRIKDLVWGLRQQAQQVDAKNEICIEISNVDVIKEIHILSCIWTPQTFKECGFNTWSFFSCKYLLGDGWLDNFSNLDIFAPCAKQIGRSHPTKQMTVVKHLFEQNQDLNTRHNCSSKTGNSWNNYCTWLTWKIRKCKQTHFEQP